MLNLPLAAQDFESFLKNAGLFCRTRSVDAASFGNTVLEYGDANVGIRLVSDRSVWSVGICSTETHDWFDVAIIRDLIAGHGEDVLSIEQQTQFVQNNWYSIVDLFVHGKWKETVGKLDKLRKERVRRLFPQLDRQSKPYLSS